MSREELGRVAYEAHHRANEEWDTNTFVTWDTYPEPYRERWRTAAEAVRAAVIAAELGPHASVVTTAYLRDLERLTVAAIAYVEAQESTGPPWGRGAPSPWLTLRDQAFVMCQYPDWQRKGEQL